MQNAQSRRNQQIPTNKIAAKETNPIAPPSETQETGGDKAEDTKPSPT
jgi:hypothetical protein